MLRLGARRGPSGRGGRDDTIRTACVEMTSGGRAGRDSGRLRRAGGSTEGPVGGSGGPTRSSEASNGSARGSILVADDNEDCRMALCALLEALGYTVYEAEDGDGAVETARRVAPDLILMDIMMPGVDGLEATRRIRTDGDLEETRIVAVSAMEGARQASLAAGCDDCVLKPIDLKGLDELVADWMSGG